MPQKRMQSPWAVFEAIEWDGKTFQKGQLVGLPNNLQSFKWHGQSDLILQQCGFGIRYKHAGLYWYLITWLRYNKLA